MEFFGTLQVSVSLNGKHTHSPFLSLPACSTSTACSRRRPGATSRSERIKLCCEELEETLKKLNGVKEIQTWDHLNSAIDNFIENVRWRFITDKGPKIGKVVDEEPLMWG